MIKTDRFAGERKIKMWSASSRLLGLAVFLGVISGGGVRADTTGQGADQVIPFELKSHVIVVRGKINDSEEEFNFIVDTGGRTFLDKKTAERLQLKKKAFSVKMNSLTLDDLRIENVFCSVLFDFSMFEKSRGLKLHGMIGSDLLERFTVTFDYPGRKMVFSNRMGPLDETESGYRLPFTNHLVNNAPMVDCTIRGAGEVKAMIDTGQPYPLVLSLKFVESHPDLCTGCAVKSKGVMVKWPGTLRKDSRLDRLAGFEMGGFKAEGMAVLHAELPFMLSVPLIGKGLLSRFRITIDYPRDEILLVPLEGVTVKDNEFSFGLSLERNDTNEIEIRGMWAGSPADRAGLEPGDVVDRVDGEDVDGTHLKRIHTHLSDDGVKSVEIEIKRGDERKKVTLNKTMILPLISK